MGWLHHFHDVDDPCSESGLPKPMLRRLLFDGGLAIGSRLLVVGSGDVRLPRVLDELGIDVVLIDYDDSRIERAHDEWPDVDVRRVGDDEAPPFEAHGFDGVIVRTDDLDDDALRTSVSEWAALLRPDGQLAFLRSAGRTDEIVTALAGLPGVVRTFDERSGLWPWTRSKPNGTRLTTLRVPSSPIDRETWQSFTTPTHQLERSAA